MGVYIELVIIDNFFITMLICRVSYRLMATHCSHFRIIIASTLGTVIAVFYPFLGGVLVVAIKLILAVGLSIILFFKKGRVLLGGLTFLGVTFLFGGVVFAINYIMIGSVTLALVGGVSVSFGLVIACIVLCYGCIKLVGLSLRRLKINKDFTYRISIEYNGKKISGSGFLDTGNKLYDSKTLMPIVLLGGELVLKVLGECEILDILNGNHKKVFKDSRYMDYSTASGSGKILITKLVKVALYFGQTKHIINGAMTGLSFSKLGGSGCCDALLHIDAINKIKHSGVNIYDKTN